MSRYPWRDTSTDIAGGQPPQWETPQGAQKKADDALKESKDYTDEQNANFNAHIEDTTIHVTPADKANWNSKAPGVHSHANATPTVPGFMSAEDKTKLNGVEAEANRYIHPATHPPAIIAQDTENRFVSDAEKAEWSGKAGSTEATTSVKGLMSPTDKQKLNGIQAAAEVNQNAFSGVNGVVATSKSDTLQLTGGTGITITEDAATKRITVTATGDATPGLHASSHITGGTDVIPDAETGGLSGLMSGSDAQFVRVDGETKTGAQTKAESALEAANTYTDQKVGEIVIDNATLTEPGIVMLSDATDGTRSNVAATEKAVGLAFQYGVERKAEVVAALNSIGVSASTSESWEQLIPKIAAVIRATGTANASQVLSGATFSNASGNELMGTMANRGAGGTVTPGTSNQSKPAGYYSSAISILGDPNLTPANIKKDVSVFGVTGTLSEGVKYASGSTRSGGVSTTAQYLGGITASSVYQLFVSGLNFRPNRIVLRFDSSLNLTETDRAMVYIYGFNTRNAAPAATVQTNNYNIMTHGNLANSIARAYKVYELMGNGSGISFITDTAFSLPVETPTQLFSWEAWQV